MANIGIALLFLLTLCAVGCGSGKVPGAGADAIGGWGQGGAGSGGGSTHRGGTPPIHIGGTWINLQGGSSGGPGIPCSGASAISRTAAAAPAQDIFIPGELDVARAYPERKRLQRVGDLLYYFDLSRGLLLFDVGVANQPALLARRWLWGTPIHLEVLGDRVVIVTNDARPWDVRSTEHTVRVAVLSSARDGDLALLAELNLPGAALRAQIAGDRLYVFACVPEEQTCQLTTAVTHWRGADALTRVDRFDLPGTAPAVDSNARKAVFVWREGVCPSSKLHARYVSLEDAAEPLKVLAETQIAEIDLRFTTRSLALLPGGNAVVFGTDRNWEYGFADFDFSDPDAVQTHAVRVVGSRSTKKTIRVSDDRVYVASDFRTSAREYITPVDVFAPGSPPRGCGTQLLPGVFGDLATMENAAVVTTTLRVGSYRDRGWISLVSSPECRGILPLEPAMLNPDGSEYLIFEGRIHATDEASGLVAVNLRRYLVPGLVSQGEVRLLKHEPRGISLQGQLPLMHPQLGHASAGQLVLTSLSQLALAKVSDLSVPELWWTRTLSRSTDDLQLVGDHLLELSEAYDTGRSYVSTLRFLPASEATELFPVASEIEIEGRPGRLFVRNEIAYVLTLLPHSGSDRLQVVDVQQSRLEPKGHLDLPPKPRVTKPSGRPWFEFGENEFEFDSLILVSQFDTAFRAALESQVLVVDARDPAEPRLAPLTVNPVEDAWWGNFRVIRGQPYLGHFEWDGVPRSSHSFAGIQFYLDRLDLSDPAHPRVAEKIAIPGVFVGASEAPHSDFYVVDYRTDVNDHSYSVFRVVRMSGSTPTLLASLPLPDTVAHAVIHGGFAHLHLGMPVLREGNGTVVSINLADPMTPGAVTYTLDPAWGNTPHILGDRAWVNPARSVRNEQNLFTFTPEGRVRFERSVRVPERPARGLVQHKARVLAGFGQYGILAIDSQ